MEKKKPIRTKTRICSSGQLKVKHTKISSFLGHFGVALHLRNTVLFCGVSKLCETCHILKDGSEPGRCPLSCSKGSVLRPQYVKGAWGDCCRTGQSPLHFLPGVPSAPPAPRPSRPRPCLPALFYFNPKDTQGSLAKAGAGATTGGYGQRLCYVISIRCQFLKTKAAY